MSTTGASLGSIRTVQQLFRDCLRLTQHVKSTNFTTHVLKYRIIVTCIMQVAGKNSPKAVQMRKMIKTEFLKHKNELDTAKIEVYKGSAVRALAT